MPPVDSTTSPPENTAYKAAGRLQIPLESLRLVQGIRKHKTAMPMSGTTQSPILIRRVWTELAKTIPSVAVLAHGGTPSGVIAAAAVDSAAAVVVVVAEKYPGPSPGPCFRQASLAR